MTQIQLIKRIEELEREMRDVRSQLAGRKPERKTFRDFVGMFNGDHDFKEAMEIGAKYRQSLRPKARKRRAAKK